MTHYPSLTKQYKYNFEINKSILVSSYNWENEFIVPMEILVEWNLIYMFFVATKSGHFTNYDYRSFVCFSKSNRGLSHYLKLYQFKFHTKYAN
mgnify:CR=1 FL=1